MERVRIALVGDHDPSVTAHRAIPRALDLAAGALGGCAVEAAWLPTASLGAEPRGRLSGFGAVWCVPASPYASMEGALGAIRFAREEGVPFLGTCGGFQHALLEYARHVRGLEAADHAETRPDAELPLVSRLACSLVEQEGAILLREGSRVREICGRERIVEGYHCSFGLNPAYESRLDDGRLRFTGRDEAGEVRVLELDGHPFFVGTLFQPERSALRGEVHPLIRAFVQAARRSPAA